MFTALGALGLGLRVDGSESGFGGRLLNCTRASKLRPLRFGAHLLSVSRSGPLKPNKSPCNFVEA